MSTPSNEPPPSNPVLTAYEDFSQNTPYVTRTILMIQVASYIFSFFLDPQYALATIPKFVIEDYEIYRLLLSPLVNTSFFSVMIAFWSFTQNGTRFERSMGSASFGWLCLIIGLVTNLVFVVICLIFYGVTGNVSILLYSASGIWNILFGTIALECVEAPRGLQRKFFFCEVPVLYFPLALLAFFTLLGGTGSTSSYFISTGIGYAIGFGKLEFLKLKSAQVRKFEDGILLGMTRQEGWVTGPAALGSSAWNETGSEGGSGMLSSLPMFQQGGGQTAAGSADSNIRAGSVFRQGRAAESSTASSSTLSASGGRALGGGNIAGTSQRRQGAAETRAARLQALEKSKGDTTGSNA